MILLHIGNSAASWTLDPRILAIAAGAFLAAATAIWAPVRARILTRRSTRTATARLACLAVALAILPAVFPYDHLLPVDAHGEVEHDEIHAAHCHESPSSCSDAPLAAGAGQFLAAEPLLTEPALTLTAIVAAFTMLIAFSTRPMLRPPMTVA